MCKAGRARGFIPVSLSCLAGFCIVAMPALAARSPARRPAPMKPSIGTRRENFQSRAARPRAHGTVARPSTTPGKHGEQRAQGAPALARARPAIPPKRAGGGWADRRRRAPGQEQTGKEAPVRPAPRQRGVSDGAGTGQVRLTRRPSAGLAPTVRKLTCRRAAAGPALAARHHPPIAAAPPCPDRLHGLGPPLQNRSSRHCSPRVFQRQGSGPQSMNFQLSAPSKCRTRIPSNRCGSSARRRLNDTRPPSVPA